MNELRKISLPEIAVTLTIKKNDSEVVIERFAERGRVLNTIRHWESVSKDGKHEVRKLTEEIANQIIDRIEQGEDYSSSFIFTHAASTTNYIYEKSEMEHKFTSTGIKLWRHVEQMLAYRSGDPNSIVSTHISPEGACNLKCPYCSVTYRDTHSRIELSVIKDYVLKLKSRGLKAVILTGGGEPTLYKQFNELVQWLKYDQNLSVALITNGTSTDRVAPSVWKAFSWVRVSINMFQGWETRIKLPVEHFSPECVVGASSVITVEHQFVEEKYTDKVVMLRQIASVADRIGAQYVRLLPNCLLNQDKLILMHKNIESILAELGDQRFFHQHKLHKAPKCGTCHQAYFRPYLSEEPFWKNGKPGAVYPCDSVVLNNGNQRFTQTYQICAAEDILDFLDRKIQMGFDPRVNCTGCVFSDNVDMLDDWATKGVEKFDLYPTPIKHEEFV